MTSARPRSRHHRARRHRPSTSCGARSRRGLRSQACRYDQRTDAFGIGATLVSGGPFDAATPSSTWSRHRSMPTATGAQGRSHRRDIGIDESEQSRCGRRPPCRARVGRRPLDRRAGRARDDDVTADGAGFRECMTCTMPCGAGHVFDHLRPARRGGGRRKWPAAWMWPLWAWVAELHARSLPTSPVSTHRGENWPIRPGPAGSRTRLRRRIHRPRPCSRPLRPRSTDVRPGVTQREGSPTIGRQTAPPKRLDVTAPCPWAGAPVISSWCCCGPDVPGELVNHWSGTRIRSPPPQSDAAGHQIPLPTCVSLVSLYGRATRKVHSAAKI